MPGGRSRRVTIAACKTHIARQKEIIVELDRGGYETDLAVSMLSALERCLQGFERHRALILKKLMNA
jgi:hypothetical protein